MPNPVPFLDQYLQRHVARRAAGKGASCWMHSALWTLGGLVVGYLLMIGWPEATPDAARGGQLWLIPALATLVGWLTGRTLSLQRTLRSRAEETDLLHQLCAGWEQSHAGPLEEICLQGKLLASNEGGQHGVDSDMLGRDWLEDWDAFSARGARLALAQARKGNLSRFTAARRSDGGRQRWWDVVLVPIRQDGDMASILALSRDVTETRQAASTLKQMNDEHGTLLENLQDGFYRLDNEYRFTQINRKAEELLRQPRSALLGKALWQLFPEAASGALHDALHDVVELRIPRRLEMYYPPFDAWYRISAYPQQGGVSVFVSDISQDIKILNASQTVEARLRLAQEVGGFADWEFDLARRELTLSQQGRALLGMVKAEPMADQQLLLRAMHPDDRMGFVSAMLDLTEGSATMGAMVRIGGGTATAWRYYRFAGAVIRPLARPDGILVGCIQEVTDQHQREARLMEDATLLRSVIDSLPHAVCILDAQARIVVSNRAWVADARAGSSGGRLIPPAGQAAYLEFCRSRALAGSVPAQHLLEGIEALLEDIGGAFSFTHRCDAGRLFRASALPVAGAGRRILIMHEEVMPTWDLPAVSVVRAGGA